MENPITMNDSGAPPFQETLTYASRENDADGDFYTERI